MNMYMNDDQFQEKFNRKQKFSHKKTQKHFLDDETSNNKAANKQFKQRKKQIIEDDDSWKEWETDK